VERITAQNGRHRLLLQEGSRPEEVLKNLVNTPRLAVQRFERVQPSLEEIFVRVVGHELHTEENEG
jgi:ABC-type uncharacterized transport system ATPase subunit